MQSRSETLSNTSVHADTAAARTPWARRAGLLAGVALAALVYMPNTVFALTQPAQAAIKTVANFDTTTWAPLLEKGPRPAAYVFTNTFCATCPLAFEALHQRIQATGKPVPLVAVLMDAQGPQALAHARHYTGVTQMYAFDGFEPEIRQTVDPQWHNITPYVVLIGRKGAVQRVIGPPSKAQLSAWLR